MQDTKKQDTKKLTLITELVKKNVKSACICCTIETQTQA